MNPVLSDLEEKIPGFTPCLGGDELKQATITLFGTSSIETNQEIQPSSSKASTYPPLPSAIEDMSPESEHDTHIKELLYSIKKFSILENIPPETFETYYHFGLVLQELALKLKYQMAQKQRKFNIKKIIDLLMLTCNKYRKSELLNPEFSPALYNWGVALTELSVLVAENDTEKSLAFLYDASDKYLRSLKGNPSNPQALNNWGLVLQEVSNYREDLDEKFMLAGKAIDKFRRSIRAKNDFDHGVYNMGTVYYMHSMSLKRQIKSDNASKSTSELPHLTELIGMEMTWSEAVDAMMKLSAQYITLACALKPLNDVYTQSTKIVQNMLPKPYIRVGYLQAPKPENLGTPVECWERHWFMLNESGLYSSTSQNQFQHNRSNSGSNLYSIKNGDVTEREEVEMTENYSLKLTDIKLICRCIELSLPDGEAFWIQTIDMPFGMYFVADSRESAECWVDAISLCHHLATRNGSHYLANILCTDNQ